MAPSGLELPPAPWDLAGDFFAVGGLMPVARARPFVPDDLEIVTVLPGLTLGAIAAARYGAGSILEYSELVVVPALVRAGEAVGGWISHIYVDDPTSQLGGQSIWGLPKELATFEWETQVETRGADSTLLRVSRHGERMLDFWAAPRWFPVPTAFDLPVISRVDGRPQPWGAKLACRMRLTSFHLVMAPEAPFASLRPQTLLGIHGERLRMRVAAPGG